ncbi:hypothetical protein AB0758_00020 [Tolypothrix bouteillei VB521301_2]|uniref:hypothetical protein n=1 Tax=Tolypothrix bouteillei TaxID=1246981 RepID=UPI0038B55CBE
MARANVLPLGSSSNVEQLRVIWLSVERTTRYWLAFGKELELDWQLPINTQQR